MKRFSDATSLLQCIDDLETLYSNDILLWDGLKESAMYNQDWLFCWCLQVRMNGTVHLDNTFEDTSFPAQKCLLLSDVAEQVGGHAPLHPCTPAPLHPCTSAPLHPCTSAPLHLCTTTA